MPQNTETPVRTFLNQKALGTILVVVALIGLYSWVNSIEPDCYYSAEVGLQIRLCGDNYVGREESANLWVPAAFFLVLLGGIVLRTRARTDEGRQDEPAVD